MNFTFCRFRTEFLPSFQQHTDGRWNPIRFLSVSIGFRLRIPGTTWNAASRKRSASLVFFLALRGRTEFCFTEFRCAATHCAPVVGRVTGFSYRVFFVVGAGRVARHMKRALLVWDHFGPLSRIRFFRSVVGFVLGAALMSPNRKPGKTRYGHGLKSGGRWERKKITDSVK